MKVRKAVITIAGKDQRVLPLQTCIDRDGAEKPVLRILVEQALAGGVEEAIVITWPGDEERYTQAIGSHSKRVRFIAQPQPLGYGHAILCAREAVGGEPFLHMVGDHLHISYTNKSCAQHVVELAEAEGCAVSAVQATRETLLPNFGTIGGQRIAGSPDIYRVETVVEKPTPTEAEQTLTVSGLRSGHYLCFFGVHVLTPSVMELLAGQLAAKPLGPVTLVHTTRVELAARAPRMSTHSASGLPPSIGTVSVNRCASPSAATVCVAAAVAPSTNAVRVAGNTLAGSTTDPVISTRPGSTRSDWSATSGDDERDATTDACS